MAYNQQQQPGYGQQGYQYPLQGQNQGGFPPTGGANQGYYGQNQPQGYAPQQPMNVQQDQSRGRNGGGNGCLGGCLAALCCCCVAEEGCEACADCAECAEGCC